jgi:sugar lactone lactonase YvrE
MTAYYSRDQNEVFERLLNPLDAVTNILLSRMNDGKVDCAVRMWVGDMIE